MKAIIVFAACFLLSFISCLSVKSELDLSARSEGNTNGIIITLNKDQNQALYGFVTLGALGQTFPVYFNMDFPYVAVASPTCTACSGKVLYLPPSGQKVNRNCGTFNLATGSINYCKVSDSVVLNSVSANDQSVALYTSGSYVTNVLLRSGVNGVVGFGFFNNGQFVGDCFIKQFFNANPSMSSRIAFFVAQQNNRNERSLLLVGDAIDQYKAVFVQYKDKVSASTGWSVTFTKFEFGSYIMKKDIRLAFNPSLPFISLPQDMFNGMFNNYIIDTSNPSKFKVNCHDAGEMHDFELHTWLRKIYLPNEKFIQRIGNECLLMFRPSNNNFITLGAPFMEKYIVIFDYTIPQISIHKAKHVSK